MNAGILPRPVEVTFDGENWQPAELTHVYTDGRVRVELDGMAWWVPKAWREVGA